MVKSFEFVKTFLKNSRGKHHRFLLNIYGYTEDVVKDAKVTDKEKNNIIKEQSTKVIRTILAGSNCQIQKTSFLEFDGITSNYVNNVFMDIFAESSQSCNCNHKKY